MISRLDPLPRYRRMPQIARLNAVAILAILGALALLLVPSWQQDPELRQGFFVPIFGLILVIESRREELPRFFSPGRAGDWGTGVLAVLSWVTLAVAGVFLAVLNWSHALVQFLVGCSAVFILAAGWVAFADRRLRSITAGWSVGMAIVLWLVAVPLPPGTYSALTLFLQKAVVFGVVNSLQVLGIPAYQAGSVIELAKADIGVNEACSGVSSLMACVATGLFVSAVFAADVKTRVVVILAAPASAVALNFVRSFVLALVASHGTAISGPWHDWTGLAIIVLTSGLVLAIALRCGRRPIRFPLGIDRAKIPLPSTGRQKILSCALIGYGVLALSLFYLVASARRGAGSPQPMDLAQLMPPPPAGWQAKTETGLGALEPILATKALACRSYWIEGQGKPTEITLYLAYWQPGQAPVSLVAAHTPDACWPGIGWVEQPASRAEYSPRVAGRSVPAAQSRAFANDGNLLHVWFWHFVGGRPLEYENPPAVFRLFHLALKYGFQPEREQLFVRISSNRSWAEISAEPIVAQFFENLRPYGF